MRGRVDSPRTDDGEDGLTEENQADVSAESVDESTPPAEQPSVAETPPTAPEPVEPVAPAAEEPEPVEPAAGVLVESPAAEADVSAAPSPAESAEPAETPAPELAEQPAAAAAPEPVEPVTPSVKMDVSWWPFLVYLGLWAAFAAVTVWQLLKVPAGVPVYEARVYPYTLLGGLVLTAAGPALILAVWIATLGSPGKGVRFVSALTKGAVTTVAGVGLWWAVLVALDTIRLGRPF